MSLLPFQVDDVVACDGLMGIVERVVGDRVIVLTDDGLERITTQARLQKQNGPQRPRRGVG